MLELLAGAAILGVGWALGRITRSAPKQHTVQAVCPCRHHIGQHEDMKDRCNGTVSGPSPAHVGPMGNVESWEEIPCTCLHYAGPELISTFTGRPIAELPVSTEE